MRICSEYKKAYHHLIPQRNSTWLFLDTRHIAGSTLVLSAMDKWICRFLDEDGSTRARSSKIADYMRSLRMLGRTSESAESAWRQLCVTCDPLVSGRSAADQFRRYLDQVEQALGPIPDDFPYAGYQECKSSEEIREARKSWA